MKRWPTWPATVPEEADEARGKIVCTGDQSQISVGGNGITLEFHVMRHSCDLGALVTYQGTAEIQTLIVGRHVTGQSAFT